MTVCGATINKNGMNAPAQAQPAYYEHHMITFVSGDIFRSTEQYIAQGVAEDNQEGLGTGLALKISRRWPAAQSAFKRHCRSGMFTGGSLWAFPPTEHSPGIIYLATQPNMYRATLPYVRKALRRLATWTEMNAVSSVALLQIAAGLGKLSWLNEVRPLLIKSLQDAECSFVVYEQFDRHMEENYGDDR
jgi:O-acetyl-ADP-ribose deacetylase (regulator of RNase III)